jgi:hypothetical protein
MARCLQEVSEIFWIGSFVCVSLLLAEQDAPVEIRELVYYGQEMGAIRRPEDIYQCLFVGRSF